MEYIYLFASSVIILTCLYFILSPFFLVKAENAGVHNPHEKSVILEDIYEAVNELEMDYLMKKITEKDFNQLKEQYQLLAANLMKQEIGIKTKKTIKKDDKAVELEILHELQQLRKQKGR